MAPIQPAFLTSNIQRRSEASGSMAPRAYERQTGRANARYARCALSRRRFRLLPVYRTTSRKRSPGLRASARSRCMVRIWPLIVANLSIRIECRRHQQRGYGGDRWTGYHSSASRRTDLQPHFPLASDSGAAIGWIGSSASSIRWVCGADASGAEKRSEQASPLAASGIKRDCRPARGAGFAEGSLSAGRP